MVFFASVGTISIDPVAVSTEAAAYLMTRRALFSLLAALVCGVAIYAYWTWDVRLANRRVSALCEADQGTVTSTVSDVTGIVIPEGAQYTDPTLLTRLTGLYRIVATPKISGDGFDVWVRRRPGEAGGHYGEVAGWWFERMTLQSITPTPQFELAIADGHEIERTGRYSIASETLLIKNRSTGAVMGRIGLYIGGGSSSDFGRIYHLHMGSEVRCQISERAAFVAAVLMPRR